MSTVSVPHSQTQSTSQGSAALTGPGGMIACMICLAAYAPSRGYPQLATAPSVVIESAFMSMCRFCFRCRRPACPSCWDEVNGVCGVCVEETHLLFRVEPSSLAGAVLPPAETAQQKALAMHVQRGIPPFVCVQPGRFHKPDSAPMAVAPVLSTHTDDDDDTQKRAVVRGHHPIRQDQVARGKEPHQVWEIATRPAPHLAAVAERRETDAEDEQDDEGQEALPASQLVRAAQVVERVLTIVVLIILIGIALLIVAALVSLQANTIIANSLNIDIRAEIAYLLQLIQQLHS